MRTRITRRRVLAVRLAAAAVAGALLMPWVPARATVSDQAVQSNWLGLGYNQDPQFRGGPDDEWTSAAFDQMAQRADYIRPGLVRIMVNRPWFDPSGAVGTYDWDTPQMRNLFRVLDHYKQTRTSVVTGMWGLNDPGLYLSPEAATLQADLMAELRDKGYTNVVRYNGINEPNAGNGIKYADWVTATTNLRTAFTAKGLSTDLIGGPDTAEAGIASYDGDLGVLAVWDDAANTEQSLVWNTDGLAGFSARLYIQTDVDAVKWTFQTSPDGSRWTDATVTQTGPTETVGDKPWSRFDVSAHNVPADVRYLRLTMPALAGSERVVSSVALDARSGTVVTDPMNDLTRTSSHTPGWTHPKGSPNNDWWLQSALDRPSLVAQSEVHFYDHEVDLDSPFGYPEAVLTNAVGQVKAANGGASVILGETGMKAPGDGDTKDYSFTGEYDHGVRMADLAVQEARAGLDGAMAWCLDGYAQETQCGMWDGWGHTADQTELRPWFYTWSLLCRYLPAGSTMYAPAQPENVRILTAELPAPAGGGWTFVLVNRGSAAVTVPITAQTGTITLDKYVYSPDSAPTDPTTGFPVPAGKLTAKFDSGHNLTVGANAVAVFTTAS